MIKNWYMSLLTVTKHDDKTFFPFPDADRILFRFMLCGGELEELILFCLCGGSGLSGGVCGEHGEWLSATVTAAWTMGDFRVTRVYSIVGRSAKLSS